MAESMNPLLSDDVTEAQRSQTSCTRTHSKLGTGMGQAPKTLRFFALTPPCPLSAWHHPMCRKPAPQRPHLDSWFPKPGTVLGTLLILKPYLQISLFICPRSFVTLIKKGGGGKGGRKCRKPQ